MPKPIPQTHAGGCGVLPSFPDGHKVATFTTTPLYHGGIADLFRAWTSRAPICLFPGKKVPITASNIVKCLSIAAQDHSASGISPIKYFSSVPYVLQMMEADPRGLQYLQSMDIVGVGGAALPPEVGDRLVNDGVNLISRFGSAECGFLLSSHRNYQKDREWQYLRVASGAEKYLRFEPQADDESLAELVVLPGWPHMAKRNREDGSLATADLFARHESIKGAWRYHSRADSQLTLITGKKFDPAPLEASLATEDLLEDVVIFGTGQPYPGALLFRSARAKDLEDGALLEQIRPIVEKMNGESQDHARIPQSMLVPMPVLETPLEKSSKGTLLRRAVEKRFTRDIEGAYSHADGGDDLGEVDDKQLPKVIKGIILGTGRGRGEQLEDDTDLFSFGIDSVAGMQIRGKLRRLLPADAKPLPINVVEDCGTVDRLVASIRRRRHSDEDMHGESAEEDYRFMMQLVRDEAARFVKEPMSNGAVHKVDDASLGDILVLTGATGALGAHVLDQYRRKQSVTKIYCLVRGSDQHAAFERVNKALLSRKLQRLEHNDTRVSVLPAALGSDHLGLADDIYSRLAHETTIIMHVAWSVNFRMKLRSFVKENIAGVTNLINLALASPREEPPKVGFCSSVASVMAWSAGGPVPESTIATPQVATRLGYSQSKWVAEQICQRAANNNKRLWGRISAFRVGQLAGDIVHGVWNEKEAWPLMLSAVKVTGSLPDLQGETLDWLPVDLAATALIQGVEITNSAAGGVAVYHVLNENTSPSWSQMLTWLRQRESFTVESPAAWVKQLDAAVQTGSQHPAAQLLDHWRQAYVGKKGAADHESQVAQRRARFDLTLTKSALPIMREIQPVEREYFDKLWEWIKTVM